MQKIHNMSQNRIRILCISDLGDLSFVSQSSILLSYQQAVCFMLCPLRYRLIVLFHILMNNTKTLRSVWAILYNVQCHSFEHMRRCLMKPHIDFHFVFICGECTFSLNHLLQWCIVSILRVSYRGGEGALGFYPSPPSPAPLSWVG